jgi:hypothetical protein
MPSTLFIYFDFCKCKANFSETTYPLFSLLPDKFIFAQTFLLLTLERFCGLYKKYMYVFNPFTMRKLIVLWNNPNFFLLLHALQTWVTTAKSGAKQKYRYLKGILFPEELVRSLQFFHMVSGLPCSLSFSYLTIFSHFSILFADSSCFPLTL